MKKRFLSFVAVSALCFLTACGQSSSSSTSKTAAASETTAAETEAQEVASDSQETGEGGAYRDIDETYLTLAAGSSGGGWYIMGAAMDDLFEQNMNVHMTLIPGGGSTNPTLVNEGTDVQIGFTYVGDAKAAVNGQFAYEGTPHEKVKGLACLNINQYLMITTIADYTTMEEAIESPKDLKIAVGPRGGGNEIMLNRYLEGLGTSLDELSSQGANVQYISTSEGYDAIKDGNLDTCNYLSAVPLSSLVEALASVKMSFIPLTEEVAQHAVDTYGYKYAAVPAGSYQYQDEDYYTLSDTVILVINSDVDDDVAYNLAKALSENKDPLVAAHASFADLSLDTIADCGIELHPGAAEYYQEMGLMN